jgi:O-antigen/teichoic acid export membrane protein
MSEVRGAVARGALWMVAARTLDRGLGFISMLVLARLLVPDDFGIIAMAMSVVAVLDLLRAFGFDVVLIQHADPTRDHYDTAWTFNVVVSLGMALLLAALAYPAALFFAEPDLPPVMICLALSPLIGSFQNIGIVDFRRNLQFDKDFRFMFISRVARFCITIPLAFALRNHWALVGGTLAGRGVEVVLSYVMHPFRPRPSMREVKSLFHFSKWLVMKNVVQLLTLRSADFVIGRVVGTRGLGLFNVSLELAVIPSSELAAPLNRAIFPGYAKHAGDLRALGQGMLEVVGMVSTFAIPAGVGLMVTADRAVPLLFGDAWNEAIPLVPVLALYGIITAVGSNTGYLFYALGRPRTVWNVAVLQLMALLPALYVGVTQAGVLGAAWAYVVAAGVVIPVSYAILLMALDRSLLELVSRIWRPLAATAAMVVAVRALAGELAPTTETIPLGLQTGALIGVGVGTYVVSLVALWLVAGRPDGAERFVLDQTRSKVGGFIGRS